jgi:hypothetical protein
MDATREPTTEPPRELPPPQRVEIRADAAGRREGAPAVKPPSAFLVALLRALSAWPT